MRANYYTLLYTKKSQTLVKSSITDILHPPKIAKWGKNGAKFENNSLQWTILGQGTGTTSSYATVKNLTGKLKRDVLILVDVARNEFMVNIPADILKADNSVRTFRLGNANSSIELTWYRDVNGGQAQLSNALVDGTQYYTSGAVLYVYSR